MPAWQPVGAPRSDAELLEDLRAVAALVDGPMTVVDYHQHRTPGRHAGASTIGIRFGSWAAALDAAGLPPTGARYRRWTRAEALEAVAAWWAASDDHRQATYAAAARVDRDLPLPEQVTRHLGGWRGVRALLDP